MTDEQITRLYGPRCAEHAAGMSTSRLAKTLGACASNAESGSHDLALVLALCAGCAVMCRKD